MKILVTGGAGFIGSHTVDALILAGHRVTVIDDLSTGKKENLNPKAKFYRMGIGDCSIARIFKKENPEVVFHFAANTNLRCSIKDPVFDAQTNILGSLNLLDYSRKHRVEKFIFASTGGAIYGEAKEIPTSESHPPSPVSPYGLAKLTFERYLEIWNQLHGLNFVALRYSNVYGPRQLMGSESGVITVFIGRVIQGKTVTINGNGEQTRDYIYIDDVIRANLAALGSRVGGVYNVGTGIETSVNEILERINNLVGIKTRVVYSPAIKGELLRSALVSNEPKENLGWEPRVSLDDGLRKTLAFFAGE